MAHGFLSVVRSDIDVFSAGTRPAEKVNPKAVEVMKEAGIDISDHTPHNVSEYINEPWDYVITVCGGAKESCPVFVGNVRNGSISVLTILPMQSVQTSLLWLNFAECAMR